MKLVLEFDLDDAYTYDDDTISARLLGLIDEEVNRTLRAAVKTAIKEQQDKITTWATTKAKRALDAALV